MPQTIQAAIFEEANLPLGLRELPVPDLNSGDVLVDVSLCTICGSDLHTLTGRRAGHGPMILGHEAVGRVAAIGGEATDLTESALQVGDRITWSIVRSCGDCCFCSRDIPQKCEQLSKFGHVSLDQGPQGGLASQCLVPAGTALLKVSDELPDSVLAPANCCTATSAAALRTAGEVAGQTVLILGAGALGLTAAAMAVHDGARQVVVADVNAARLRLADSIEACRSVTMEPGSVDALTTHIADLTEDRGVDLVLEMTGATAAFGAGLQQLRIGGRLILVGAVFPDEPLPLVAESIVRRLLRIEGVHNYRPDDLARAVRFLHEVEPSSIVHRLVESEFPLAEVNDALQWAMKEKPLRVGIRP